MTVMLLEEGGTPQNRTSSSSSSATPSAGMSRRLRRMLSTPTRWNSESPSKRSAGESTVESLLPANLLVTVEPLATMGAVGEYILQRVKFFRGCLGGGSRAFMEDLLMGEDDDDDEEAFLMGLHGDEDDDIDDDEDGFDDDDIILDDGQEDDDDDDDRHLAMFAAGRRKRTQDDEADTLGSSTSRAADEEAIKRMMAEACGGGRRGRSARRRAAALEDEEDGHKESEQSPRRKNGDKNGVEKVKSDSGTPAKPSQEPTGVVISLDGSSIPSSLTVVQAVWLAAMRKKSEGETGKSSVLTDGEVGSRAVSARTSMMRSAKPPPSKSSRFVIAVDSTNERSKTEDGSGGAEPGAAARVGISGVISSIWGTTHELEFKLTYPTDEKVEPTSTSAVARVAEPHEPKVAVCGRPVAFKERVKSAAEGVEKHFAQIEGQNWDGLDRLVQLLVSLSKLRPKDSPVPWTSFACPTLSKRQLSASSSPLGLITSLPDDLKVAEDRPAAACSKLVSVAPVLFDTEARRRVMASSCFGLHRALHSINDANVASEGPSSPTSHQQQLTALPRQKVRIRRDKLLESAMLVMNVFGAGTEKTSAALEIEFMGEVGTGSGPTNEFYACVAEELKQIPGFSREAESRLFPVPKAEKDGCNSEAYGEVLAAAEEQRKNPPKTTTETSDHSPVHRGRSNSALSDVSEAAGDITANVSLPSPMPSPKSKEDGAKEASSVEKGATVESSPKRKQLNVLEAWRLAGHVVARCILDNRLVDLDIHPVMWELVKEILATEDAAKVREPCVYFLSLLDPTLHRTLLSLKSMSSKDLQVLDIDATKVPGYEEITVPGLRGAVNGKNVAKFVDEVATVVTYTGVYWQLRAFADAFAEILSPSALSLWRSEDELTELTYGSSASRLEYWTKDHLLSAIQPKHGYTSSSQAVKYLVDVMANDLSSDQRQQLVRFLTGSPTLPIGGFAALKPQLTVVRQVLDDENANPDDFLPSVMTCASFMKLPDYSSKDALKRQLLKAISEGQKAFLMS
ncbi:Ubiquitin-protein ligase [Perkinsus chesapeaki]|uniref:Ubiquitin-protein ligase n=1 Tax=Perkinsus chesapeaki TaxID=330153 RepID=A0A7J6LSF0_PERCH|nr:Ubiquitin-protein ligase [Perkinsus chesapeaki]